MPSIPAIDPELLASFAAPHPGWRWPDYDRALSPGSAIPLLRSPPWRGLLGALLPASFVEWRYYAVISDAFRGIVGLALVNPRNHFPRLGESGVVAIVAGILDRPANRLALTGADGAADLCELCWMHLFPFSRCTFDDPSPGSLTAEDRGVRLRLTHRGGAGADLELESVDGLAVRMTHDGIPGMALAPVAGTDLRSLPGAHWIVHNPSPVALASGEIRVGPESATWPRSAGAHSSTWASAALLGRARAGAASFGWTGASGYYEHSFGIQPLPLHGWDFLFVPDAQRRQGLVMQTYRGSSALRYIEVCWQEDGTPRHLRFAAEQMRLEWAERCRDPVLGAVRPLRRMVSAEADGLRLAVDARVVHRVPLLRHERPAPRHFFICEEIGIACWSLSDERGRVIAQASDQPCGSELAHPRLRVPGGRTAT